MAGPWEKYGTSETSTPSGPWSKYAAPDQEREKIVSAYAEDIMRRNDVYRTIPQAQIQDPERLWKLATLEAERNGYAPPQREKMDKLASGAVGYGQGGTFGFADELSGAVDFVGGAGAGLLRGEGMGAIESGKEAYSKRVEQDRTLLRRSQSDNPISTLGGELAGGIITYAPAPAGWMGAGARTTGQVAVQTAAKADKFAKLARAASGSRAASLSAKSADLTAKAARLSLPAKTVGEGAARFGGRVAESAAKGVGYGAAYGGLYGFGAAEGSAADRLDETAQGALIGGAAGGVLSPAMQFVLAPIAGRIGYGMFTTSENKALDIILKRAERSGTSLQKVRADFDAWAKTGDVPETLAELMGPNERSLLSAMITVNRETREAATDVFVGRGKEEVNRLEDAFGKSFGAGRKDFQTTKTKALEARAKEAEPFYEGAYVDQATGQRKFLGQNETDALVYEIGGSEVAQETLPTAWKYADGLGKREIRDELKDFAAALAAGRPVKPLSVEAADYIERGINRRYGAATKGDALDIPAGLRGLRDRVRGIIDPSGLGDARAVASEAIRRGELLDEGLGIMSPTVDVDDVNRIMQGVPEAGIPAASPEGRTAYGAGAARAVANALRQVPDMGGFADATRKVARNPALRDKLEAARPKVLTKSCAENKGSKQTKANAALDTAIERASNRAQFGVDMVGNSKTAFRQGDVEDAVLDDAISSQVGQSLSDLLITGVGGAGNQIRDRLARTLGNRLGQPAIYRPQINRAASGVLLATGEQIPIQLARLARRAAQRGMTRVTMRGLPGQIASGSSPTSPRTPPSGGGAGPIRAGGFAGFGGKKPPAPPAGEKLPEGFSIEPTQKGLGGTYKAMVNGQKVGELVVDWRGPYASLVKVDPAYRRSGIASALYDAAEADLGTAMIPSPLGIKEPAREFWRTRLQRYDNPQKIVNESINLARKNNAPQYARDDLEAIKKAIKSSGLGAGLRSDIAPGAVGGFIGFNQDQEPITADNIATKLRNAAIGVGVGVGANRIPVRQAVNALDTATTGLGGGGRGPRKPKADSPEAIKAGVQKIVQKQKANNQTGMKIEKPEGRLSKGLSKLSGVLDDPVKAEAQASAMHHAGRSADEIWDATKNIVVKIDGRTLLKRGPYPTQEENIGAFWQAMALPASKRPDWVRRGTKEIFPKGPDAIAQKPFKDRAEYAAKRFSGSAADDASIVNGELLWEETGVVAVLKSKNGQPMTMTKGSAVGSKAVAMLDGKQFRSWKEAMDWLKSVAALPRNKQPKWYTDNFSEVLDAKSLRKPTSFEIAPTKARELIRKHPIASRGVAFATGGALGTTGVTLIANSTDRRQPKNALAK